MMRSFLAATALFAAGAFAQTTTDCSPLLKTDCPVDPAIGMSNWTWVPQTTIDANLWNNTGGYSVPVDNGVANFTLAKSGQAPTIKTNAYFFYGTASVMLKVAPGQGIISAMTLLSDDLDEIDFEFKGGNKSFVFTNWYGKYNNPGPQGNMTQGAGEDIPVSFDPTADYHNYTINWTNDTIQWYVDSNVIRTAHKSDPEAQGGKTFPQTPMRLYLGGWSGGDSPSQGTVDWAGGKTDWSKAPFTLGVKQVYISDATQGSEYSYGDQSGSSASIKVKSGNSTFEQAATDSSSDGTTLSGTVSAKAKETYNSLSSGAKIGIACGVAGVVVVGMLILAVCCVKQRRAGRKERDIADAEFQKHEAELMAYRQANGKPQAFTMPAFGHQDYKQHM